MGLGTALERLRSSARRAEDPSNGRRATRRSLSATQVIASGREIHGMVTAITVPSGAKETTTCPVSARPSAAHGARSTASTAFAAAKLSNAGRPCGGRAGALPRTSKTLPNRSSARSSNGLIRAVRKAAWTHEVDPGSEVSSTVTLEAAPSGVKLMSACPMRRSLMAAQEVRSTSARTLAASVVMDLSGQAELGSF